MTAQPSYPGYATPTFTKRDGRWFVVAEPWSELVGWVYQYAEGCSVATANTGAYVGLFPDKQAAGEALVKHAGYEVLR